MMATPARGAMAGERRGQAGKGAQLPRVLCFGSFIFKRPPRRKAAEIFAGMLYHLEKMKDPAARAARVYCSQWEMGPARTARESRMTRADDGRTDTCAGARARSHRCGGDT